MILFSKKTHVQIYGQPCLHKRQEGLVKLKVVINSP